MGDTTGGQIIIYSTTPEEAGILLGFIDEYGLTKDFWGGDARHNVRSIELGATYGAEVGSGMVDNTSLFEQAPNSSYIMWTDPKYEWLGAFEMFTPELGVLRGDCDADGQPVVDSKQLLAAIDKLPDTATVVDVRAQLEALTGAKYAAEFERVLERAPDKTIHPLPEDEDE